jgi:hypothetical protein
MTTWRDLFDRAADHDVRKTTESSSAAHQNAQRSVDADVADVRAALAERRDDDE